MCVFDFLAWVVVVYRQPVADLATVCIVGVGSVVTLSAPMYMHLFDGMPM